VLHSIKATYLQQAHSPEFGISKVKICVKLMDNIYLQYKEN